MQRAEIWETSALTFNSNVCINLIGWIELLTFQADVGRWSFKCLKLAPRIPTFAPLPVYFAVMLRPFFTPLIHFGGSASSGQRNRNFMFGSTHLLWLFFNGNQIYLGTYCCSSHFFRSDAVPEILEPLNNLFFVAKESFKHKHCYYWLICSLFLQFVITS